MTLTEFLLARIAEDEKHALSIQNAEWFHGVDSDVEPEVLAFAEPTRVLAECAAKRRIVELFPNASQDGDGWNEDGAQVLELLALPYADHPDYRQEWRP